MRMCKLLSGIRTFRSRQPRAAICGIWVWIDGVDFPEIAWDDFAVVILSEFASAVHRLSIGRSTCELIYFMNGPYTVEMSSVSNTHVRVRALQGMGRDVEIASAVEEIDLLRADVVGFAENTLAECSADGAWSRDEARLEARFNELLSSGGS